MSFSATKPRNVYSIGMLGI